MKKLLSIILSFLLLISCSQNKEIINEVEGNSLEEQMIKAYNQGKASLENGDVLYAAKKFNEAELIYPQSGWASRASLMAAYSYWLQGYNNDSVNELKRFLKVYPNNPRKDYAYYLLGVNFYDIIVDEKKDLFPLIESKKYFKIILDEYPNTEYALDARYKLDLIEDMLAAKEMYIAKHYIQKQKWIPALNRLKTIINQYDQTIYIEEALFRIVEIYHTIGLEEESIKYASVLGYNYQSSEWYKQSYRILNKNYKTNIKLTSETKKEKKLLDKIKSFF